MADNAELQRVERLMRRANAVFVFGSNEAGIHGRGAALTAVQKYGAVRGAGFGLVNRSYAIPTKDYRIQTLLLPEIAHYVRKFLWDATERYKDRLFVVTRIGCGLAGYRDEQIAPLFQWAPDNCALPIGWREINGELDEVEHG